MQATKFYFENKDKSGFAVMHIPELSEPIFTVKLDAVEMQKFRDLNNWYLAHNIEQVEILSSIFDIPESELIEFAAQAIEGADLWELVNLYEDLTCQEISNKEDFEIAQNEYWQEQMSLSWS